MACMAAPLIQFTMATSIPYCLCWMFAILRKYAGYHLVSQLTAEALSLQLGIVT